MGSGTNQIVSFCLVLGHLSNQIYTKVAVEAFSTSFTWMRILTKGAGSQEPYRACYLTELFQKLRCPESFPHLGPMCLAQGKLMLQLFPQQVLI